MKAELLNNLSRDRLEEALNILKIALTSKKIDHKTFIELKQQILKLILINVDTEIIERKRVISELKGLREILKTYPNN